jgi:hypothetical protein
MATSSDLARSLNEPMLNRLRQCAADASPNRDGQITIYPPEARHLVALIDATLGEPTPDTNADQWEAVLATGGLILDSFDELDEDDAADIFIRRGGQGVNCPNCIAAEAGHAAGVVGWTRFGAGHYESSLGHKIVRIKGRWYITFPGEVTPDVDRATLREAKGYVEQERTAIRPSSSEDEAEEGCGR